MCMKVNWIRVKVDSRTRISVKMVWIRTTIHKSHQYAVGSDQKSDPDPKWDQDRAHLSYLIRYTVWYLCLIALQYYR
jgi:hypothetical protein